MLRMSFHNTKQPSFISMHGLIYTCYGLILILLGISRGELFSTICGTLLTIYSFLSLLQVIITFLIWKTIPIEYRQLSAHKVELSFSSNNQIVLSTIFAQPFFLVWYYSDPTSKPAREYFLKTQVTCQTNTIAINPTHRGVYYAKKSVLLITDRSAFFSLHIPYDKLKYISPITIQPEFLSETNVPIPVSHKGITIGVNSYQRSEELYESRTYHPGDDPRKINWKLFAHTGKLSVRQGDLLPPPADQYYIFINCQITTNVSEILKARFDELVRIILQLSLQLQANGKTFTLSFYNESGECSLLRVSPLTLRTNSTVFDFLSLPQLFTSTLLLNSLSVVETAQMPVLWFTLPYFPEAHNKIFNQNTDVHLYLGPEYNANTPQKEKNSFFSKFRIPVKNEDPTLISYSKAISSGFQRLKKRKSLHVYKI